ncbi:MAG: signal peptidase II [Bacillota bacterium]
MRKEENMLKWVALSLVADRVSKELIHIWMEPGQSIQIPGGILRLTYVTNSGAAFGILSNHTGVLTLLSALMVALVAWWYRSVVPRESRALAGIASGLLVGGALGNLIDRILHGHVLDFFDLGFWPVFNVADIAVVAGCVVLFLLVLKDPEAMTGGTVE